MRGYKTLIQEAEVLAMSPDAVAEFLKARAAKPESEIRTDAFDLDAERALLARGNPLIDLALARYSAFSEITARIFHSHPAGSAPRLACLSNRLRSHDIIPSFPMSIFGDEEETVQWLLSAVDLELCALLENPSLSNEFLRNLLERKAPFDQIDFDRLRGLVMALHRNERMQSAYSSEIMDGFDEYSYGSVFDAAWSLAEIVPVTAAWAQPLGYLFDRLQPVGFSIDDPLALASRWADQAKPGAGDKAELPGWLNDMQSVRRGLAQLALGQNSSLLPELLAHPDVAFRCGAYGKGVLTPEQMKKGYELDGELMFNECLRNMALWRDADRRRALHDIAWAVVKADKHSDLLAGNQFKGMESHVRKQFPAWFSDEDDYREAPDEALLPATKADLVQIGDRLDLCASTAARSELLVQRIFSRSGWIFWFSLGALVMALAKH